jgi:serine phosphatase RsbU (regulator of sigma subunit)
VEQTSPPLTAPRRRGLTLRARLAPRLQGRLPPLAVLIVGCVLELVEALVARRIGASSLVGLGGALGVSIAVTAGVLTRGTVGAAVGAVGSVVFVAIVGSADGSELLLDGVPVVLLWTASAGGAGAVAGRLRRRVADTIERAGLLYAATAEMAAAPMPADVADRAVRLGPASLGAAAAWLGVVGDDGTSLERVAAAGFPSPALDGFARIGRDEAYASVDVVRTGTPRWLHDAAEFAREYPAGAVAYAPGFEALAVLPLTTTGRPFGCLSLHYREPRRFTTREREHLVSFAAVVAQAFDRARLHAQAAATAETLQRSLLPLRLPTHDRVAFEARYLPARRQDSVGGDWYDVIPLPEGRLGATVGDVSGKGISAAAIMGRLRVALRAYALEGHPPGVVLEKLNTYHEQAGVETFATALYLVLEPDARRLSIASAGHLPPLICDGVGARVAQLAVGPPLGCGLDTRYGDTTLLLEDGSSIVLYTDGVVERRDTLIDTMLRRFAEAAGDVDRGDPREMADRLLARMMHQTSQAEDDRALVVIRCEQPAR